ncbi:iron-sulfur cluster assembly scaffold protein [Nitrosophilus kaiyonis]|uniref:iron-sulfur cluster assembly scaffold protein n=1 Tax=Nitrosophilus kaiyonis TaxID=2930200 RepID=UPI002492F1D0|nr:iron-sulfur cluster assembly scaffold protein [Nitrosophilus kaiyonis]
MEQIPDINPAYLEHMIEPKNYGKMEEDDAKGIGKNKDSGEMVIMQLKIDPKTKKILDIKWQTNGCGTTLVSGSLFSIEYKRGTIQDGIDFTNKVLDKIKDNPPADAACGEVVARAFLAAIKDYEDRKKGIKKEHIEYVTLACPVPEESE